MSVQRLDHVQLAMPPGGEERAREFYQGVLGIPEIPKPADMALRGGCWFERGELKVHLGVEAEFRPARKAHPGFIVSDLPGLVARCRAAGFALTEDPSLPGHARVFVQDPFGNRIELMEPQAS
jgi:catechol 2,3-dioxygenase-like lactoylglutathione lyase family enzyme